MLLLYLRVGHAGVQVPAELAVDATVADLKAAAQEAGGPPASLQVLSVGGTELRHGDGTELSDTGLISAEVVVDVRRRHTHTHARQRVSCGRTHGLALLDSGAVVGWGEKRGFTPIPHFGGTVESVHAGDGASFAVVEGRVVVWGCNAFRFKPDVPLLPADVVCCSTSAAGLLLAAVDSGGTVYLCGPHRRAFGVRDASLVFGCGAVAVSAGTRHVTVLSPEGEVTLHRSGSPPLRIDLGGKTAVHVSSGYFYSTVVLDDGRVRAFRSAGECFGPAGVSGAVSCSAGVGHSVALRRDGTLVWWGPEVLTNLPAARVRAVQRGPSTPHVAVACGMGLVAATTADGRVVCSGSAFARQHCPQMLHPRVHLRPTVRLRAQGLLRFLPTLAVLCCVLRFLSTVRWR